MEFLTSPAINISAKPEIFIAPLLIAIRGRKIKSSTYIHLNQISLNLKQDSSKSTKKRQAKRINRQQGNN